MARTCLYIGDIGDNDASRGEIVVYRLPEPGTPTGSAQVDRVFRASYPDRAHDAEARLAAPDGTLYIVTKDRPALYRLPTETRAGAALRLERVGPPLSRRRLSGRDRITDGAISPDGKWVVLRTHVALGFYRASAFLNGDFREAGRVDLRPLGEPQGEGVAFGPSNTFYLVGEGGGGSRSGTMGRSLMRQLMPRACSIIVCVATIAAVASAACTRPVRTTRLPSGQQPVIAELWQEPDDRRDLFYGPGGKQLAPRETAFTFLAEDTKGFSPGFDVRDDSGMEWSVKTGLESQSEVVTSRILWAIGFHQPPTYYLDRWSLKGSRTGAQEPGRFRPELPGRDEVGEWSWYENPFVGTPEYGGLIVTSLLLTSWDWKTSNNTIYQLDTPVNGVTRWFVVRDLGASLGRFTYPTMLRWFRLRGFGQGTRNDLPGFEQQPFIERIDGDSVEFSYKGLYRDIVSTVTPDHVRWACERVSRLSDRQWNDAFRAGGYTAEQTARYTKKIKDKVAQGLQLTARK